MRKILLMTTGLAWLALTGAAGAAVTVTLTPGPLDPLYFEPEAVGLNHFPLDGITWTDMSGAADTERGSVAGLYAAPEGMGTSTTTGTTYMAVEGGGTETATFATPQTSLSLYWGSIDGNGGNLNSISISMGAYTLTGMQLAMMGADGNGNQGSPLGNELVTITGLAPFTDSVVLLDGQCVRVQPRHNRRSGAVDPGDDGHRIRRAWLCGVPTELEGAGARYLISSVSKPMRGAAARRPFLLRQDFRPLTQIRDADQAPPLAD